MTRFGSVLASSLVVLTASGAAALAGEDAPRAVLELFTSQGCSSCPPADAILKRLSDDKRLVTLSFAVDYWDYLGWKDTYATTENSARQRAYAEARGDRAIYTPQVVVNGRIHVIGSDAAAIESAMAAQDRDGRGLKVDVGLEMSGDELVARVADAPAGTPDAKATVWLVLFDTAHEVPIGRGENKGQTVTYSHVVRRMQPIGMWKGKAMAIELPRADIAKGSGDGFAVILQVDNGGKPGPILGAALKVDRSS